MTVKPQNVTAAPVPLGNAEDAGQMPSAHIIKTNKAIVMKSFTVQKLYKLFYYLL